MEIISSDIIPPFFILPGKTTFPSSNLAVTSLATTIVLVLGFEQKIPITQKIELFI